MLNVNETSEAKYVPAMLQNVLISNIICLCVIF